MTPHRFLIRFRLVLVLGAAGLVSVERPAAQTVPSGPGAGNAQTFAAASIRRTTATNLLDNAFAYQPGRFLARNQSIRIIIASAYGEPHPSGLSDSVIERVVGGPSWLDTDRYDIEGKTDPGVSDMTVRGMVRALLEDRMRLKVRVEKREMPIYALVQAGGGAKLGTALKPPTKDECTDTFTVTTATLPPCGLRRLPVTQAGLTWTGREATLAQLADAVEGFVDRAVVDRTGLAASYAFAFSIPSEQVVEIMMPNPSEPGGSVSKLSSLLQEQLGLRLEISRGPVDVLVVDSVERPSDN